MKFRKVFATLLVLIGLFQFAPSSSGFALLGPFAPWMQETNGVVFPSEGDIGGPMEIGSGYRWNVPIVTYGFDQSFLDYFGTNGVAAVESAFQILNDLPPASDIVLTNYPFNSQQINDAAQTEGLYDLKSVTLSLLLEQMGLAQPTRYIFVLKQWTPAFLSIPPFGDQDEQISWGSWAIPGYIVQRNFDPQTLDASTYVNQTLYSAYVANGLPGYGNSIVPFAVNPFDDTYTAVTDFNLYAGEFYTGLTYDDVGGLCYLFSTNNINYETLLPSVLSFGPHENRLGHGAWRPGVEKITFVPHPFNPRHGKFLPMVNQFTDTYIVNGKTQSQFAIRVINHPDFLFCAADTGENSPDTPMFLRTGTTNWLNNAALNGNTNGEGPGVIQPPIKITFHKLGPLVITGDTGYPSSQPDTYNQSWGSFNNSTQLPIVYPPDTQPNNRQLTIRLTFRVLGNPNTIVFNNGYTTQLTNCTWHLHVPFGGQASLQISTNRINWTSLATVTNAGAVIEWYHFGTENPPKFFRAIPR
jgi:hypothetical protein